MYDTESVTHTQALALINGEWDREVVPRLPANTAEMASRFGAFERSRNIRSCTDLLRGLLSYVSGEGSLQATGAWALLIGLANVSASDWRKRLCRSRRWLEWLMTELIGSATGEVQSMVSASHGYQVWLVDATRVGQEGGTGDDWRLHIAYDWLAGKLASLKITDVQGAEGFWHLPDTAIALIWVADRAYGYRDELFSRSDRNQEVVVRISPRLFPCLSASGTAFDIAGWLGEKGGSKRSCWVFITSKPCHGEASRQLPVRLIAQRISGAAQQRALSHAKEQASKHGHSLSKTTEEETEWIVIATTLSERWSVEEVLLLYRARWLIERLFKLMKSLAHLARLPTRTPESSEAYLSAWFVFWLLQEEVQEQLRQGFAALPDQDLWQEEEKPLSRWTMTALTLCLLSQQIRGVWTQKRWEECASLLRRFCCPSSKARTHWETFLRHRLAQGFAAFPVDVST